MPKTKKKTKKRTAKKAPANRKPAPKKKAAAKKAPAAARSARLAPDLRAHRGGVSPRPHAPAIRGARARRPKG